MKELFSDKKRTVSFFSVILIEIILMLADFYTTYRFTPDLQNEANPFVSILGGGWRELITVNLLGLVIPVFFAYLAFLHYTPSVVQCGSFKEYASMIYYEQPDKFNRLFYWGAAKNKSLYWAHIGYIIVAESIILRAFVVMGNILASVNSYPCVFCFFKIRHTVCNMIHIHVPNGVLFIPVVLITVAILFAVILFWSWLIFEYRSNKKALKLVNS